MNTNISHEFNKIGEKITIEIQLSYDEFIVSELPKSCAYCPVGFQYRNCGREQNLNWENRSKDCKLRLLNIDNVIRGKDE